MRPRTRCTNTNEDVQARAIRCVMRPSRRELRSNSADRRARDDGQGRGTSEEISCPVSLRSLGRLGAMCMEFAGDHSRRSPQRPKANRAGINDRRHSWAESAD